MSRHLRSRRRVQSRALVRNRYRPSSFELLEDRTLLSNVTVANIETGLGQLGAVVNQTVSAVQLLAQVPFLQGLSNTLTGGAQNLQSVVNTLINDFDNTAQAGETVSTFLDSQPTFTTADGTVTISNVLASGSSAYQFTISVNPKPQTFSLNVSGSQTFGLFKQLDLGSFTLSLTNQVQLQAVVQIDSSGNLLVQRSSQTFVNDTPTIGLSQPLTISGSIPVGGSAIQVMGFIGGPQGLNISPQATVSFGTQNDFVGLSTLLGSATTSFSAGTTINIPIGVGVTLNSGDSAGDQLPQLVYQRTYQFNPASGSLAPSQGQILAGGVVVATEQNGQTLSANTAAITGAVLHDVAGPIFDKYESYIPQDVRDFLLGNTQIGGMTLKQYLFGESPLDLVSLALESDGPIASAAVTALEDMLEVGKYGSMMDNLSPTDPTQQIQAQIDAQKSEYDTGIKYNILDDPVGTILSILSGQAAPLVTWKFDAVTYVVRAASSLVGLGDDPVSLAAETVALEKLGIITPLNPSDPNSELQITVGSPVQMAQGLLDALKPVTDSLGLGNVLSDLDQVFGQIGNLGLTFNFHFYGGATFGVNSSFLTDPTAHGILDSLYIAAPGMNGPGSFGSLFHVDMHAGLDIDLPQDLTSSAAVGPMALSGRGITPDYGVPSWAQVSAGNGQVNIGPVSIGGALGQAGSAVAGAFPGGAQAVADNLWNAIQDPAGTLAALVNKLGSLSLHLHFDVNNIDVTIPAGNDPSTPTQLTAAEIADTPSQCLMTFNANATLDLEGSLSAVGHDVLSGGTGQVPLLEFNTQCNDNAYVAQEGGLIEVAGTMVPFASADYSDPSHIYVDGTPGDDVIAIEPLSNGGVQIWENGQFLDFPTAVTLITVELGDQVTNGGNDSVSIDPSLPSSIEVDVHGGSGNNTFTARNSAGQEFPGEVVFQGGTGNNTLIGGAGYSTLSVSGGAGTQSTLQGGSGQVVEEDFGSGTNTMIGGSGDTEIFGGTGNDTIIAGTSTNYIYGGSGNQVIRGPSSPAGVNASGTIIGGRGNDIINVGTVSQGNWVLIGGAVNPAGNSPLSPPDTGSDIVVGGAGNDTIILGDAYQDGSGNYHPIIGTGGTSAAFGGPGNDNISGGSAGDFISGGWFGSGLPSGDDTISTNTGPRSWGTVANMPGPRVNPGAAVGSDGRIYAIGGYGASGFSSEVDAYDPATGSWTTVASLPVARDSPGVAAGADGRIYVIGGYASNGTTNEVDVYDPSTNIWSRVANLPSARFRLAATSGPGGMIYAIGGDTSGGNASTEVDAYNPATNTWTIVASLLSVRDLFAATAGADGKIYAIGGFGTSTFSQEVDAYDPSQNTWTRVADLPSARDLLAAATGADGYIYAIGGYNANGATSEVDYYDPSTNTWYSAGSLPTPRAKLAAATGPDGTIYALGGSDSGGYSSQADTYSTTPDTVVVGNVAQATTGGALVPIDTLPPPAPVAPTLVLGSDTGVSSSDGVTRMNGSPQAPLVVQVSGVYPLNSSVQLYDDTDPANPIPLGLPVQANGSTANITLNNIPLADGVYQLAAQTTAASTGTGAMSDPFALTVQTSLRVVAASPSANFITSLPGNQIVITFNHDIVGLTPGLANGSGFKGHPFVVMLIPSGPDGGALAAQGKTLWTAPSGVDSGSLPVPATAVYIENPDGTSTITLTPHQPLASDIYLVSINSLTDLAGNAVSDGSGNPGPVYFSFDYNATPASGTPLFVTGVSTLQGSVTITSDTTIPQPDTIGIAFSEPLNTWTVNTSSIHLYQALGPNSARLVNIAVAYSPTTQSAYVTPQEMLFPGATYYLVVDPTVADDTSFPTAQVTLGQSYITSFQVQASTVTNTVPLTVTGTVPVDGTVWTAPLGYGAVSFSEAIDLSSLSRFSAMLIPQTGGVTTGTSGYADVPYNAKVAFNPNTNQLIIVPTGTLTNGVVDLFSLQSIKTPSGSPLQSTPVYATFLLNSAASPAVRHASAVNLETTATAPAPRASITASIVTNDTTGSTPVVLPGKTTVADASATVRTGSRLLPTVPVRPNLARTVVVQRLKPKD